jgi:hypothetical protein
MIDPHEHSLVGHWVVSSSGVSADQTCARIEALVSRHLLELAHAQNGWRTLYQDPRDGRLWERIFPNSDQHGCGPPALHCVSSAQARAAYGYEA